MLNSCYKKRFALDKVAGGQWNPEIAAPLIKSELTMGQIIERSTEEWKEYPDGLLSLIYRNKVATKFSDSLVTIPNQSIDTSLNVILPSGMIPGDSTLRIFKMNARVKGDNNETLDSIFIKKGFIDCEIVTNLNHDASLQLIIPSLTRYGVTFYENIDIPKTNGSLQTIHVSFPLNLFTAKFNHPSTGMNVLEEFLKVAVKFGPQTDNSPYVFKVTQSLRDLTYYNAYGYFGQFSFSNSMTQTALGLFDNGTVDETFLEDPKVRLKFYNSYGAPINVNFDQLYVEKFGATKNFVSTLLPSVVINGSSFINTFDTTEYIFDRNNSNIIDIFNFQPRNLFIQESYVANPGGTPNANFIMDTSRVYLESEVELPLYGRTLNFTLGDSSLLNIEKIQGVNSVDLRINLANMFPAEAVVQLYLQDSLGNVTDSLLAENQKVLVPAIVGPAPDYRTNSPLSATTVVSLTGDKMERFFSAKYLKYEASLSTSEQGQKVVKIYSDYFVRIQLAVKLNYTQEI